MKEDPRRVLSSRSHLNPSSRAILDKVLPYRFFQAVLFPGFEQTVFAYPEGAYLRGLPPGLYRGILTIFDGGFRIARGKMKARKNFNWNKQIELSIDPEKARRYHEEGKSVEDNVCTMCGEFCAIKKVKDFLES
jgi:hypothetical protein